MPIFIRKITRKTGYLFLVIAIITASVGLMPVKAQNPSLPVYIVQPGDSLYAIAQQFFTTIDAIKEVNALTSDNVLSIGDRLFIPGLEGLSGVLTTEYVPLGLNLRSLSRRSQSDPASLIRLNKFTSQSELFVGRKITTTVTESNQNLRTLPSLGASQSWMEVAVLHSINYWKLANLNSLSSPIDALPYDTYFVESDSPSENNLAIPGISSIVIDNLPLVQGGTFVLKVQSDSNVEIAANLAGTEPVFFPTDDGDQIALGGIHALLEPGAYPLYIIARTEDGTEYRYDQWVIVESGNFGVDAPLKVDPESVDEENIAKEDAFFKELVSKATPVQQWEGTFQIPTKGVVINSYFGSRRTYNGSENLYYHTGIDIGWDYGIDVFAPAAGTVVAAIKNQIVRGNVIVIDHGLGVFTIYMHLEKMFVEEGDQVQPGQKIAELGNTGRSSGPHLHFEIDVNGIPVNPLTWLNRAFP